MRATLIDIESEVDLDLVVPCVITKLSKCDRSAVFLIKKRCFNCDEKDFLKTTCAECWKKYSLASVVTCLGCNKTYRPSEIYTFIRSL